MALPTARNVIDVGEFLTGSQALATPFGIETVAVDVFHELDRSGAGLPIEESRVIPASAYPTLVTVKSHVLVSPAAQTASKEYIATVRRRKARRLADSIAELGNYADREDFTAWTFPVLEQIRGLLTFFADAENEGNTREILRQLRDTFMNGGWDSYRQPDARSLACEIVKNLATAEEVMPRDVDRAFDRFIRVGINPVGSFLRDPEMDQGDTDGEEEEEEVLD